MGQKSGITSLVAPHYPELQPNGQTIMRDQPPANAVLDRRTGKVSLRYIDPPGYMPPELQLDPPPRDPEPEKS